MFFLTGRATAPRRRFRSPHLLFMMLLLVPFSLAYGQGRGGTDMTGTGGRHVIQGRIYFPSGRGSDMRVQVKLQSTNAGELSVLADANGSFSFRGLSPGSYTVVIEGGDDYETARETVFIDTEVTSKIRGSSPIQMSRPYTVMFYLQPKRNSSVTGAKPGVVNAALAGVPAQARDLYLKAAASIQAGDTKKAIEQLRGAIAAYPEFALAYNELGVQYLKLGQPIQAVESLRSAVKFAAEAFSPRLNYGIALLEKKDFAEAEAQLREALKRNDGSAAAHLYLGITLISLRRYDEAEPELRRAVTLGGGQMSLAHYYLGGIYWGKKEYKRAADELETYLKLVPKASNAEKIRATIKSLREKA